MQDTSHILIAEDEIGQAEILKYNLEDAGFRVSVANDGETATQMIEDEKPDLLVLDWMMPEMSGIKLMRWLRARDESKGLPVIMLTARGEEDDRLRGFEVGVDDFVVKPYLPSELVARINAVMRRSRPDLQQSLLTYADIVMDLESKKVTRAGKIIKLGPTEFRLLKVFLSRPGKVFSRNQLLDLAWGHDVYVEDRTVDVAIRRLRMALNMHGLPDLFRTVRSEGYAIDAAES
ncbi:DNA-binding response regulator [Kordiimonas sediminis]|uniref:Phosphate regulon transcriptional regulatory protein PhoB n=1 Tax=Kordiimonas sediminis TaxID=1735581 RepID=A0A919AK96_9PROT|nr:phosphate regulon transcriptional regulator PhoB [Kordiimonas sediminis]GHF11496.1 DNA-binding response regulator [Kordiimonas sediminis]